MCTQPAQFPLLLRRHLVHFGHHSFGVVENLTRVAQQLPVLLLALGLAVLGDGSPSQSQSRACSHCACGCAPCASACLLAFRSSSSCASARARHRPAGSNRWGSECWSPPPWYPRATCVPGSRLLPAPSPPAADAVPRSPRPPTPALCAPMFSRPAPCPSQCA